MKTFNWAGETERHFEAKMTLYIFASDYYDGQWSRLYRLYCRLGKHYQISLGLSNGDEYRENDYYRHLEAYYTKGKYDDNSTV